MPSTLPPRRRIERQSFDFELDDGRRVIVEQVRDPRARRIRLLVDGRGVRLTLPRRASGVAGRRFLAEHGGWLAIQLARFAAARPGPAPLEPGIAACIPLRGEERPVYWRVGHFARVQAHADGVAIQLPVGAPRRALCAALRDFYEGEARADLGRWLPRHLAGLPQPPRAFRFKRMSTLWGSLGPSGDVSLDLSLVLGRARTFEYVLVHELCHLLERNHSRAFWRQVEQRIPDWREDREYLRRDGAGLKEALAALVSAP